ncbi:MAG: alpha/beta hydrolase [Clostridiales bacterium]
MPSLKSRLFVFALKYRHLLRFQLKRTNSIDANTYIPNLRRETEKSTGIFGKLPEGIEISQINPANVYAEWICPKGTSKKRAILYFHGGGYVVGSSKSHRAVVSKFVKGTGIPALVFDYSLAPENPFPDALNDAVSVYCWMLGNGILPSNIVFSGDSAGAGLLLATLLALKEKSIPMPAGAVALSPWTDLKNTGESLKTNIKVDTLTWAESWTVFSKYYAAGSNTENPLISPLYGDLRSLPPIKIYAGGDELLRDDSVRFAQRAKQAGVEVSLKIGEGLFHCYPVCSPLFPEAKSAMEEICNFIKERLSQKPAEVQ